ncbi:MAG: hypothetical protein A2Y24_07820 [Clostridiales bacterium GWE2_32_10]|nr:MAG: hypothetical protein A2Y24_07820 [Clostridiales bacterium GWE2_32_10]HBY21364.1 short-chain dehydrogenase [Clostridiales bacterium]
MEFKDKIVLITGASRGIGREIALSFAREGASVIGLYNNSCGDANSLLYELNKYSANNAIFKCNVSDYNDVKIIFEEIKREYKQIDVLINNAGILISGLITDLHIEEWNTIINTNLNSFFYVTREILPSMIFNKSGSIINISSIYGIDGASCEVAYSASKGGVNAFTRALSKEVGPSNIRVNAIAPGYIDTDMHNSLSDEEKTDYINTLSLMKGGTPCDVAELCLYLASDRSKYMTGQIMRIDGGL